MENEKSIITLKDFLNIPFGEEFASGKIFSEDAILFKWIAKKGGGNDWAIYFGSPNTSFEEIAMYGLKMYDMEEAKKLVNCTDEVIERYRR